MPSSSAIAYRKGLSVEPGERTPRTMSTWAARRASEKSADPA